MRDGANTKSYKDLLIWAKASLIFQMVCSDVKVWPKNTVSIIIAQQVIRSASSISANISEGYGRGGPKEFEQFLRIARGSLSETDNWLYQAMKENYISEQRYQEYCIVFEELSKMLSSFINKLRLQKRRIS